MNNGCFRHECASCERTHQKLHGRLLAGTVVNLCVKCDLMLDLLFAYNEIDNPISAAKKMEFYSLKKNLINNDPSGRMEEFLNKVFVMITKK